MFNATRNTPHRQENFCSSIFEQNFQLHKMANYQMPIATNQLTKPVPHQITKTDNFISSKGQANNDLLNASIAVGTAGSLSVAQAFVKKLSEAFAHLLMAGKEFTSAENVKKVANAMKENNGLKANIHFIDNANKEILKKQFPNLAGNIDIVANGKNAFYTKLNNITVAPKSKPSLILHEIGHAINNEKSTICKALQKSRVIGYNAPAILLLANHFFSNKKDGEETFIEKHAGKLGFVAFLPTIIEEGTASLRGINAAKQTLGKGVNLGHLKRNYFFAWMTYLLGGIGIGLASKLAVKGTNQTEEKTTTKPLPQQITI